MLRSSSRNKMLKVKCKDHELLKMGNVSDYKQQWSGDSKIVFH